MKTASTSNEAAFIFFEVIFNMHYADAHAMLSADCFLRRENDNKHTTNSPLYNKVMDNRSLAGLEGMELKE